MLNAIEQGILTESTKQRLQELEQIKKKIEADIAKEKISKPKYTREQYKEFFDKYKTSLICNFCFSSSSSVFFIKTWLFQQKG